VLATISKKLDGYPFGSRVPFVLDHTARPVIYISRLAEHTKSNRHCNRPGAGATSYGRDARRR